MMAHRIATIGRVRTIAAQLSLVLLHPPPSLCSFHTHAPWCASSVFRSRTPLSPDVLPIVELRVDRSLMEDVTNEILTEHQTTKRGGKGKRTAAAARTTDAKNETTKEDAKDSSKKSAKSKRANSIESTSDPSNPSLKRSARRSTAASTASNSTPAAPTVTTPTALDDEGSEEWKGISQPFANKADEAEFLKWQRILEEEEKRVDEEMKVEALQSNSDAGASTDEPLAEAEQVESAEEEQGVIDEEVAEALDANEEETEELDERDENEEPASEDAADVSTSTISTAAPIPAPARIRRTKGVVEDGVRTRMLNVGGEQVMELTGVDEDDLDGENGEMDDAEEEWSEDVDMSALKPEDTNDPESEVGKGVGGVSFTRKEIMELSEDDLIETYTKGSGRGGQKVNKTNSCVQLLHLPTGTRVKCQFSRELQANRARARTIMRERLEELLLGTESRVQKKAQKERRRKDRNRRRRAKKYGDAEVEGEGEGEGEEGEDGEDEIATEKQQQKPPATVTATTKPTSPAAKPPKPRRSI